MTRIGAKTTKRFGSGEARPTSGKVLLALFNILGASGHIQGARFLDLFSGTGGVAVRALECGGASVVAVESDRARASQISKLFAKDCDRARASCICMDVRRALPKLERDITEGGASGRRFDIIFCDPPYELGWGAALPALIKKHIGIIAPDGVFVLERSSREEPDDAGMKRDDRVYGDTVLSFYWMTDDGGRRS